MYKLILCLLAFITTPMFAQDAQWGYKILSSSSELSDNEFSAIQALGMPNVLPAGMRNIKAWQPKGELDEEFLKVGFLVPIKPKQIIISESYHPGFITKVLAYDTLGKEYDIAIFSPKAVQATSRVLLLNVSNINLPIVAIKIVLKINKDYPVGIDAIGMSTSDKLFKMKKTHLDIIKAHMIAHKLDTTVNSVYREMGPLVSPDGKTMYFSRRGDPRNTDGVEDEEDIWISDWDEAKKKWGTAQNMGAPLNNEDPNFINSVSPDGNTVLLGNSYMKDGSMEDGVSVSTKIGTGWSFPKRLIIEDDKNVSDMANYFKSNSEKILLISNDRKGDTYGVRDIYVSFLKNDTTWTKPLNLGKTINTAGTEAAPFLAADDKTLYFTSDGLNGYGGSDIFMSRRLDSTWQKWSKPENLGPIVNTTHDESYLTLTASANKVYFTSQIKNSKDVDMYTLTLPKDLKPLPVLLMTGRVINSKTNEIVPNAKILFENLYTGVEVGIASSNPTTGVYQMILPSGTQYGYLAHKKGFISVHANIDLRTMTEYKELYQDLYITPIEVGEVVVFNNIFFDFDKSNLKKTSFLELNRLAKILIDNKSMRIEISANTDNVGAELYNDVLSIKRATAVVNYLLSISGVNINQITMKSYGENNPVASNKTAKGRKLNRRVEFKIMER